MLLRNVPSCLGALALASLFATAAPAQTYLGSVSTSGFGSGPANPFGLAFGPNGHLYVALSGVSTLGDPSGFNNKVVVRIDPATATVVGTVATGFFPEEIAFAAPAGGGPYGVVTNSTDGSVTVFDVASDTPLATVALPVGLFGAFPFGVATSADGTRAYVAAGDGTQSIRVVDLDPSSATQFQLLPAEDLTRASGGGARILRFGADLLCPTNSFGAGSVASFERLPLPGSANAGFSFVLGSDSSFATFPAGQDVVVTSAGRAIVCGYQTGNRIYVVDLATGMPVRSFPSGTFGANSGGLLGLALSPDERVLVACDGLADQVSFLDLERGVPMAVVSTQTLPFGGFSLPNDAVFSADGSTVWVTAQGSEAVLRFSAPPAPPSWTAPLGLVVSDTVPAQGAPVTLSTVGTLPSETAYLLVDEHDDTLDFGAFGVLHMTLGSQVFASAAGADASITVSAPVGPAFFGLNFVCQGIAIDLGSFTFRISDAIPVVIQ